MHDVTLAVAIDSDEGLEGHGCLGGGGWPKGGLGKWIPIEQEKNDGGLDVTEVVGLGCDGALEHGLNVFANLAFVLGAATKDAAQNLAIGVDLANPPVRVVESVDNVTRCIRL